MNSSFSLRYAPALAILVIAACTATAADDTIPRIDIENVPLADAIRNLARHSGLNYILDPRVPGSEFGRGRLAAPININVHWTNLSPQTALSALLKAYDLTMVTNPATSVMRIAPANQGVKPIPASQVSTNASAVIPLMVMDSVPLTEAITKLANAGKIAAFLDPELQTPAFAAQGTVSFRWERITTRQALAALLDNYDLVMTEDPATSSAKISRKRQPEKKQL